jgi:hypothetical protein
VLADAGKIQLRSLAAIFELRPRAADADSKAERNCEKKAKRIAHRHTILSRKVELRGSGNLRVEHAQSDRRVE